MQNLVTVSHTVRAHLGLEGRKKFLARWHPGPYDRRHSWPRERRPSSICPTMPNSVAVGQTVRASVGVPKTFRGAGTPSHRMGACPTPRNTTLPHKCYDGKFGRSNDWCVIMEIHRKSLTFSVSLFKVIQGHWKWRRSVGHPWLPISDS